MARLVWMGVGAVGGIYVYRKGERAADVVREQGFIGTVQILAAAAIHSSTALRDYGPAHESLAPERGLRVGPFRVSREPTTRADADAIMDTGVGDAAAVARGRGAPTGRKAR